MPNPLTTFADSARGLSKNPLGIIALFIVLVYAMAALVLGVSAAHLQPYERVPLVYFLVLFPLIVLCVFAWLVTRHHKKLYAPSDFRGEANFIRSLTPEEQRARVDAEVQTLTASVEALRDADQGTSSRISMEPSKKSRDDSFLLFG